MDTHQNTPADTITQDETQYIEPSPLRFALKETQATFNDSTFIENCIKEGVVHTLGVGAKLKCDLFECDGGIYFDGEIHGNLEVRGSLVVGKNGYIFGNVIAKNIYNFGSIDAQSIQCTGSLINRGLLKGNLVDPASPMQNTATTKPTKSSFFRSRVKN